MRARMTGQHVKGLMVMFVTFIVLVATSQSPRGRVDTLTVQLDGGCGTSQSVITFDDNACGGRVSNVLGQDFWQVQSRSSCSVPVREETFDFVARQQSQVDGGIPTADGGTRLVQPQDDLEIRCTATPDDAGHAVECTWNICARGSSVLCVTEPRCSGRFSPVP
jgi:hypothetical protein